MAKETNVGVPGYEITNVCLECGRWAATYRVDEKGILHFISCVHCGKQREVDEDE